jgi:hypothetical protein
MAPAISWALVKNTQDGQKVVWRTRGKGWRGRRQSDDAVHTSLLHQLSCTNLLDRCDNLTQTSA